MFRTDKDIADHGQAFAACTLPKSEWTHAGHFAAALWLLQTRGLAATERDMPEMIRRYNEATGVKNTDTEGYHHTITLASLRAAHFFWETEAAGSGLTETLDGLLATPLGQPKWLAAYWTRERLFSVKARHEWVEPDLGALPWTHQT